MIGTVVEIMLVQKKVSGHLPEHWEIFARHQSLDYRMFQTSLQFGINNYKFLTTGTIITIHVRTTLCPLSLKQIIK